jgi:hypothetical protein
MYVSWATELQIDPELWYSHLLPWVSFQEVGYLSAESAWKDIEWYVTVYGKTQPSYFFQMSMFMCFINLYHFCTLGWIKCIRGASLLLTKKLIIFFLLFPLSLPLFSEFCLATLVGRHILYMYLIQNFYFILKIL